jgi:hypothetical protein
VCNSALIPATLPPTITRRDTIPSGITCSIRHRQFVDDLGSVGIGKRRVDGCAASERHLDVIDSICD